MINLYLIFLIVLIPTIVLHEIAHFIACKIVKCGTDCVNIGFGKPLFSFYYKNTRYNFTPWLLGGYVKLEGEMELTDSPTAFVNLKYHKKVLIAVAGCTTNIISGCLTIYLGKKFNNFILFYFGFFSIISGVGNLLPIPGLDGCYPILFLLEKFINKEKLILSLNQIIKWAVRIILFLNILLLPWFVIRGISMLNYISNLYWRGII